MYLCVYCVCVYIYIYISSHLFNLIFHLYIYSVIINIHATSFSYSRIRVSNRSQLCTITGNRGAGVSGSIVPFGWIFVEHLSFQTTHFPFSLSLSLSLWERTSFCTFTLCAQDLLYSRQCFSSARKQIKSYLADDFRPEGPAFRKTPTQGVGLNWYTEKTRQALFDRNPTRVQNI